MKRYFVIILLLCSLKTSGRSGPAPDTISYWKVYNAGKLLKEGNIITYDTRITLAKKNILATDTFRIEYFDDTPCADCMSSLIIKTKQGAMVRKIEKTNENYLFNIVTTNLRALASEHRSRILKFYFREDETDREILLFEVEIK